jgi:hypothetical protein
LVYILLQAALAIEATGICSGAWFLALIHKKVAGFQLDEVYVGTPEERAAADNKGDASVASHGFLGTNGVLSELPKEFLAQFSNREKIIGNIKVLREQLKVASNPDEKSAFEHSLRLEEAALARMADVADEHDIDIETLDQA